MLRIISILSAGIVTSLYFFPFFTTFLPGVNTKMVVAAFGLAILWKNKAQSRDSLINKDLLVLTIWALAVSLAGFITVTLNETYDYTFATYFISMWVWLGGAYAVTQQIKHVHGTLSVRLVGDYLIGVCVVQCVIAFLMGQSLPLKDFVDSFLAGEGFMGKVEDRLYGIGASLDVAGMKFAAVLMIITCLSAKTTSQASISRTLFYIISFLIIATIGNMMGRTTTTGVLLSVLYLVYVYLTAKPDQVAHIRRLVTCFFCVLVPFLLVVIHLYNTDAAVRHDIRFAFEGFFSLFEQGEWETNSNEILKGMYVFPDNMKTWIIGDGYFDNPNESPYYTGPQYTGFYHDTDVGYLRFIYYFGMTGLLTISLYMCRVAGKCMQRFREYRLLFLGIAILNFIVWFKVSSDLFSVFALFLCIVNSDGRDADCQRSLKTT